tara:strand:+ start:1493 stop:2332 length:840 start_codon:yes stop_codon:yes gene_type:complete
MLLPTGKPHVSFSEIKVWKECSYRHKLAYVDKLDTYENNPYADYGTAVHNAIENYLKTKSMDIKTCLIEIDSAWVRNGYDTPEYAEKMKDHSWWKGEPVEVWQEYASTVLKKFPSWLDEEFPDWELVDAEHQLYESIEGEDVSFKGFVDCLIKAKDKKGKELLWVIDWKTTGKGGWFGKKRKDFLVTAQVGLYKRYIARKLDLDLKEIRCAYVFLKRGAKTENCIETFKVSVGPKFVERADKLVSSMVKNVKKGFTLKNYNSCKFCPFANSEHCNGGQW